MELFNITTLIYLFFGLFTGIIAGFLMHKLYVGQIKKRAQFEAQEIISEAKSELEIIELDQKEKLQEIELELWTKEESTLLKFEENIEELEELATEKKQKSDDKYSQERQRALQEEQQIKKIEDAVINREEKQKTVVLNRNNLKSEFTAALSQKLSTSKDIVIQDITAQLVSECENKSRQYIDQFEEDTKTHVETKAKSILDRALVRFHRAYSSERGIAAVYFDTPEQRSLFHGPQFESVIQALQEVTGCEITVADDLDFIGVAGFDPVRRELARRILERCLKEKRQLSAEFILKTAENIKRELLSLIKKDGDQLAKELKLEGLHPEIRQVMGSLRYRYSFTQNQYFHCAEVGWLCGLLATELGGVLPKKARRSGLLHDLGKAMDHELDGGHAVIGANFIQERGEAPDIVHAVKSHHYDEQPSTDLAYLVIAADAISGARPGARRSTVESYNQKVSELEKIAKSFQGVTDCFILSGGRECRVLVNGKQIDDRKALDLSAQIAKQIELECNYPGQIKVVVVREVTAYETTKAHA